MKYGKISKNKYIQNKEELIDSILEFSSKPQFWKKVFGSGTFYFLHVQHKNQHFFGTSKFCVFKDITVEQYIGGLRNNTGGTNAKNVIRNNLASEFIPYSLVDEDIQFALRKWLQTFYTDYDVIKAQILSLGTIAHHTQKQKYLTPEALRKILDRQRETGEIGEIIAYRYEINRLKTLGIKNPEKYVDHIAKKNVSAGFDISSITSFGERYIEVKSSTNNNKVIYLTENEVKTLKQLEDKAYIYIVKISKKNGTGQVIREIKDPIKYFNDVDCLTPIAFKVNL